MFEIEASGNFLFNESYNGLYFYSLSLFSNIFLFIALTLSIVTQSETI